MDHIFCFSLYIFYNYIYAYVFHGVTELNEKSEGFYIVTTQFIRELCDYPLVAYYPGN